MNDICELARKIMVKLTDVHGELAGLIHYRTVGEEELLRASEAVLHDLKVGRVPTSDLVSKLERAVARARGAQ